MNTREQALLDYLGLGEAGEEDLGIEPSPYYADHAYSVDGSTYYVVTDAEADALAKADILESLWAFNAEFIVEHSALPKEAVEMVKSFCETKCESANETVKALITDIDEFVADAIAADGRGHFLDRYTGNEGEQGDFYIYQID